MNEIQKDYTLKPIKFSNEYIENGFYYVSIDRYGKVNRIEFTADRYFHISNYLIVIGLEIPNFTHAMDMISKHKALISCAYFDNGSDDITSMRDHFPEKSWNAGIPKGDRK